MTIEIKKNPAKGDIPAHWLVRCHNEIAGWILYHPGSPAGDAIYCPPGRFRSPSAWDNPAEALHYLLREWIESLDCIEAICEYWTASPARDDYFRFDTVSEYWEAV